MPKAPLDRSVAAVDRTLRILDAFVADAGTQTLGQLEQKTGLFKSVICRYLLSFERSGYIVKAGDAGYRLGPSAFRLGRAYDPVQNLGEHVMPVLKRLAASTAESASFYIRDDARRLCLYRVDSPHSLRVSVQQGSLLPIDDSATGQVFKRYRGAAPGIGVAFDDSAITCSSNVGPDLTSSMSVPVFGAGGPLVGALTVSGPTARFEPRLNHAARRTLARAAGRLSET
ncbi:MAG: IclR family transcriptional regulator, partial [Casimicrobiaceae bacterium]